MLTIMPSAVSVWILTGTSFKGYVCITTGIAHSPCVHALFTLPELQVNIELQKGYFFPTGVVMMIIVS